VQLFSQRLIFEHNVIYYSAKLKYRREQKLKQEEITNLLGVKSAYHGRKQSPEVSVCSHNSVLEQMFIDATESSLSAPEERHPSSNHFGSSCTDSIRYVLNRLQLTFFSLFHYANNSAAIKFVFVVWRLLTWVPIKLKSLSEELI
jgi:hypothetical protein